MRTCEDRVTMSNASPMIGLCQNSGHLPYVGQPESGFEQPDRTESSAIQTALLPDAGVRTIRIRESFLLSIR